MKREGPTKMPMKNPERAIATLTGEVHALFMLCQGLVKLHVDQHAALVAVVDEIHQKGIASIAPTPVPEATIEGFEFVMEAVKGLLSKKPASPQ